MRWVVLSYSLPAAQRSSPRVAVWRRLRAIGAVSPKSGIHVLPARDECIEALQWLAQEVGHAKGEALLMHVDHFEGLTDAALVELFQQRRRRDYGELDARAAQLEKRVGGKRGKRAEDLVNAREALQKLEREHAEITRIDFFDCPERSRVAMRLARIARMLSPNQSAEADVAQVAVSTYRDKRWVTRPRPHVDRLACVWLIRRFVSPHAAVRYSNTPEPDEIAFDMKGGEFGHRGNLCTFETMLRAFALDTPGLRAIAEIVHEIDLRDDSYVRPEIAGVDAILTGWQALPDTEREAHGVALFEGLYVALSQAGSQPPRKKTW